MNNIKEKMQDVIAFRKLMGLPVDSELSIDDCVLHMATIGEEFIELVEADTLVDQADALVDLAYTVISMVAHDGGHAQYCDFTLELIDIAVKKLGIDFDRCWDEVHRSNMSKACRDGKEVVLTQTHYKLKGVDTYYEEVDGLYIVKCEHDENGIMKRGKALKSINYSPADLSFL